MRGFLIALLGAAHALRNQEGLRSQDIPEDPYGKIKVVPRSDKPPTAPLPAEISSAPDMLPPFEAAPEVEKIQRRNN